MKYFFANWKMYLDNAQSVELAEALVPLVGDGSNIHYAIFPTALAFAQVTSAVEGKVSLGAQHCAWTPTGAYTGAVSAELYKRAGATYALVGHSERRHIFGESDHDIRKRFEAILGACLIPVLCIGETKEEKESGKREYRLKKQLMTTLEGMELGHREFFVAYEPVWAIGTGDACTPADADDIHHWIEEELRLYTKNTISILYGGSVNASNVSEYLKFETIAGVLVGSASSNIDSFRSLIAAVQSL